MSLFTIDKSKCKGDGKCAFDCPVGIIKIDPSVKLPIVIEGKEDSCINCGHCLAICPHGALSLSAMPLEACPALPDNWNLSPNQVEYLIKGRRSIRLYKDEPVSRDILEKIINIASYAPSGINLQPVRWLIIYESDKVKELASAVVDWMKGLIAQKSPLAESLKMQNNVIAWENGQDRICRNAPHLVIAYALKDDHTAVSAATIALSYFDLAAVSLGLGTCWAGYLNMALNSDPVVFELLGISKRCVCLGAMMAGYPKYKYFRIPQRNKPAIKWK